MQKEFFHSQNLNQSKYYRKALEFYYSGQETLRKNGTNYMTL